MTKRPALLALAIVSMTTAGRLSAQLTISSEIQGAAYPRQALGRDARQGDFRGSLEVEYRHTLSEGLTFRSDLIVYGPHRTGALLDGTAALVWRRQHVEVAAGMLRERWGRFSNSNLDPLGPANTVFSLLRPEQRLSQPMIRTTTAIGGVSLDLYLLGPGRLQPLPDTDRRFSLGLPSRNVVRRGALGDQAVGVRASGTSSGVDWSAHAFVGRSRRPTFVPRFSNAGQPIGVDAVYTNIQQFGADAEKTVAAWRLIAEGFVRKGAMNISGREQTYIAGSAAAEYQRFGVLGGAYDFIPRVEVTADGRGTQADLPFASSVRIGARLAQTRLLPFQIEPAYAYDVTLRAHGLIASVEKAIAESPNLRLGFRFTKLTRGAKPSLLDAWKYDLEVAAFLRIEVSPK